MEDANKGITRRNFLKWLGLGAVGTATTLTIPGETSIQSIEKEHQEIVRQKPAHVELHSPESTLTSAINDFETLKVLDKEHLLPLIDNLISEIDQTEKPPLGIYFMIISLSNLKDELGREINLNIDLESSREKYVSMSLAKAEGYKQVNSPLSSLKCKATGSTEVTISLTSDFHHAPMNDELGLVKEHQITLLLDSPPTRQPTKWVDESYLLIPYNAGNPTTSEATNMRISKTTYSDGKDMTASGYTLSQDRNDGTHLYAEVGRGNKESHQYKDGELSKLQQQFQMWQGYFNPPAVESA
jgi:hypothetical protein